MSEEIIGIKNYVLGFIFDNNIEHGLFIKKHRPRVLMGYLNGLGGLVEKNESFLDTLNREVKEESGIDISNFKSINYGRLCIPDFGNIYLYCTKIDKELLFQAKTTTDEEISILSLDNLRKLADTNQLKGNVMWMVEMAKNVLLGLDNCRFFDISEDI